MNFGKVGLLATLFSIFILSACGQKTLIYSGKSVNWSVHYEFTQEGEFIKSTGFIEYIGTEPAPDKIEYSLKDLSGNGPLNQKGVLSLGKSGCSPCSLPSEDSEFEAIIKWNDRTETITLKLE